MRPGCLHLLCRAPSQDAVLQLCTEMLPPSHERLGHETQTLTLWCACSWTKTLVVVSHARNFLNEVATDVIHLHSRKMTTYRGNFNTFEKTAHERLKNARKQAESQQQAKDHMQVSLGALDLAPL